MAPQAEAQFGFNVSRSVKRVKYINASGSTKTLKEGEPMCYNFDTTTNILGYDKVNSTFGSDVKESATTAEGYQNEGKFLIVENPAEGNLNWLAGAVAPGNWCGQSVLNGGEKWIEVFEPNGQIVALRTNANCTVGTTVLGVGTGGQYFEAANNDDDPLPCALAEETVDRSSTNGLVLAKLFPTGQAISGTTVYLTPVRPVVTGYMYGVNIDGTSMLTGTAASKSYVVNISGYRESAVATGDSNDAMLKVSGNNEAACDSNFVFAGINAVINNRSGGTLGRITNTISVSLKQGSTAAYAYGLQVDAQDLAATAKTEFGGLDIAINREGLAATTEFGLQLRTRGTINSAVNSAIRIDKDATDHGFINLFSIETDAVDWASATVEAGHVLGFDGDGTAVKIPIVVNGVTYYLLAGTATALVADA